MCPSETQPWESSGRLNFIRFILKHISILISNLFKYLDF